ncbi:MAG: hypothetical protein HUJ31_11580, partial [Pseudomonadales bacterium]|nr:hypothetical protein [Pseudomonadales bacterium]
ESCVEVQTATLIQIHTETAEGEIVEEGTSADLVTGAEMEASGMMNESGCIAAELIIIEEEETDTEA